ncbi:MAG: biotin--[acetyl-CoA-carboxylase] ligase [candidate division Zixibacteria bacterium]|nr:biotin--[acetyl-CoA-carboxylase] ligase [candidate division Zixibacteria bacterium]
MKVFCDHTGFAKSLFDCDLQKSNDNIPSQLLPLTEKIFTSSEVFQADIPSLSGWKYGLVVEEAQASQYDTVIDLCQQNIELPDGLFCVAGSSTKFHGQRGRTWASPQGNIYLTAHVSPKIKIDGFGVGFPILAAVSVVETIDSVPGLTGQAGIKWVNDILIDNAKVSGFLAYSQNIEGIVNSTTIGIGLNVLSKPHLPLDKFVQQVTSLAEHTSTCTLANLLPVLLKRLWYNYHLLLTGQYRTLLDIYRNRSVIIGQEVEIISDPIKYKNEAEIIASGRVTGIGDNLELFIEGNPSPITHGRLILKNQ